jgi:hypothetical protein
MQKLITIGFEIAIIAFIVVTLFSGEMITKNSQAAGTSANAITFRAR